MHWGTFPFGVEAFDRPVTLLKKWWQEHEEQVKGRHLHCPRVGQAIAFDRDDVKMKQNG